MAVSVVQSISVDLYHNSFGLDIPMKQNEYSFTQQDFDNITTPFYDFDEFRFNQPITESIIEKPVPQLAPQHTPIVNSPKNIPSINITSTTTQMAPLSYHNNQQILLLNRKRAWNNVENDPIVKLPNIENCRDVQAVSNNNNNNNKRSKGQVNKTPSKEEVEDMPSRLNWPDDIDLNLDAEISSSIYNGDSLFTTFTAFKQELPSPSYSEKSPTEALDVNYSEANDYNFNSHNDGSANQRTGHGMYLPNGADMNQGHAAGGSNGNSNNGFGPPNDFDDSGNPVQSSPVLVTESDVGKFQYILHAATAIGQKNNEDSLTYLNQGQSYEIRLKKLGDLSAFRGKTFKSIIKICFHERRLQYMEKEQMRQWQDARPGERILELDIPLTYGITQYNQPHNNTFTNVVEVIWDPLQDCGIYIRVNCISTEFTPKKHGGEKGVPFRIQIESYEDVGYSAEKQLKPIHAAACQIKVFKLKGADRKHKQDREKILKRPPSEQEKYQQSFEYTILNEISRDHLFNVFNSNLSPEQIKRNVSPSTMSDSPNHMCPRFESSSVPSFGNGNPLVRTESITSTNGLMKLDDMDFDEYVAPLTADYSPTQVGHWLTHYRLTKYAAAFSQFSGVDLLRMSKDDLIQICGLADGIRMYNVLHSKTIAPRLTIYLTLDSSIYHAIYLHANTVKELFQKLHKIPGFVEPPASPWDLQSSKFNAASNSSLSEGFQANLFILGPANVQVLLTDEVLNNVKNDSLFVVEMNSGKIIFRPETQA